MEHMLAALIPPARKSTREHGSSAPLAHRPSGKYPGHTGREFPWHTGRQYPGQYPGHTGRQYHYPKRTGTRADSTRSSEVSPSRWAMSCNRGPP